MPRRDGFTRAAPASSIFAIVYAKTMSRGLDATSGKTNCAAARYFSKLYSDNELTAVRFVAEEHVRVDTGNII